MSQKVVKIRHQGILSGVPSNDRRVSLSILKSIFGDSVSNLKFTGPHGYTYLDVRDNSLHGVDPHAPAPHDIHLSIVDVPEVRIDLTYEQQQHVLQVLNHYQSRFKFKEDLYTHLRGVVHEMVDQNNDANQN